jgi:hypothetical protein
LFIYNIFNTIFQLYFELLNNINNNVIILILEVIKEIIGINSNVPDGDVVETLVKMFKQKKIGQLIEGKNYKVPLDSDLVTFFNDKDAQRTIKEYEYLLNEK